MALDMLHSCASRISLKITLDVLHQCGVLLKTYETANPSCLSTETFRWHLKYQTFQWRNKGGPCQDFCCFFPERHVAIALPLLTAYHWPGVTSFQQQKPVQFSSHSRVSTLVLPVPAVEKHPLLGQEHPALLDHPDRADFQGWLWMWGMDHKQYKADGTGRWSRYSELSSRLLGDTPILTSGLSLKYKAVFFPAYPGSQYRLHPRWLISENCNIGPVIMSCRQHTKYLCSTTGSKFVK